MRVGISVALLVASSAPAQLALAGNDDELFVGSQAAMTGGAVSAMVSDASATWYNPAGLGAVPLDQIDVSGTFYTLRSYSAPGFLTSSSGASDHGSVVEFVSVPSQVAYVRRLAPGVSLGLGYFVPQASNLVLRESLAMRPPASADPELGSAGWQLALNGTRVQHTAGMGLGFALSDRVRCGFSLIGTYQDETQSVSLTGMRSQGDDVTAFVSTTQLGTASQLGMEVGAGFQIALGDEWRLGLSLRSARLLLYQSLHVLGASGGVMSSEGETSIVGFMLEPRRSRADFAPIRAGRAGLGIARGSAQGHWASFEVDVQPGVHNEQAGVDRRAVLNARLGGYYRATETLAVGAGVFTDRSPDSDTLEPLDGRGDFYGASLGIELSDRHRLEQDEKAESLSFTSTFALRYAFSDGQLNDVLVDPADLSTLEGTIGPLVVHELGFYLGAGLSY